jgi:transcriptional regulator with GAF, ATPase, and Fis domain
LTAAGINLLRFEEAKCNSPYGIVCFGELSEELFSVLQQARRRSDARVLAIFVSSGKPTPSAWRVLHAGSSDVLTWDHAGITAKQISSKLRRWLTIDDLTSEACLAESLVGKSPAWYSLLRNIVEAAHFSTSPILLTGESGTGKELLAKLVSRVARANGDGRQTRRELITVDCGTLIPELSGSELFGHERGAFTGAHVMREGAFALADGATLLLDEIGDVPLTIQAQLLRAIQERTYKKVGGNIWQSTNFRLVCATNRDLEDLVSRQQFRLDLYHRIAGCIFHIFPLRKRKEDILPLASCFLREIIPDHTPEFDPQVREYLLNRSFPGNIRELRQLIRRVALRYSGAGPITVGDVPEEDRPAEGDFRRAWPDEQFERSITEAIALGTGLKQISQASAQIAIRIAVESEKGNLQRAATRLGITDRALQMRRAAGELEFSSRVGVANNALAGTGEEMN